jgi:hypothetical protein
VSVDEFLDELEVLATVEHALIVEYSSVCCALGHDLEAEEGGASTTQGHAAAAAAFLMAQNEMFFLARVNHGLVAVGRLAQLGRAASIASPTVEIPLDPPGEAQLYQLLAREEDIASAVDWRYGRLRRSVASDPLFQRVGFDELRSIIADGESMHFAALAPLRDSLRNLAPSEFLRASRREASDGFERRLLQVSDRNYSLVLAALRERFAQSDRFLAGSFREFAVSAMFALDDVNRALVQRGLLPPFTLE